MHGESLIPEREDALAKIIEHMAKRMNSFSRAEFSTDFGVVVLTKMEVETEEVDGEHDFYRFELKGELLIPKVEGTIHFYY